MPIYARAGVRHRWLVDVSAHGGEARVRAEPFDAVELTPARWWLESVPMR